MPSAPRRSRTCRGRRRRAGSRTSTGRRRRSGVRYGTRRFAGRVTSWPRSIAPPLTSPPTRLRRGARSRAGASTPRRIRRRGSRARSARPAPRSPRSCRRRQPFGTWQYAHAVCRPAGARESSKTVGCASSTNGRSAGGRPRRATPTAEISSSVPPRWTVPAGGSPRRATGSARERPVELERARPMAVRAQLPLVALRQPAARDPDELARHDVCEHDVRSRQLVHRVTDPNGAAEPLELAHEAVGDLLRPAARERPAERVAEHAQRHPEARARPPLEREHRVRRVAGEEPARPLGRGTSSATSRAGRSAVRTARCAPARPSADTSAATARGGGGCGPSSTGSTSAQAATSGPTSAR